MALCIGQALHKRNVCFLVHRPSTLITNKDSTRWKYSCKSLYRKPVCVCGARGDTLLLWAFTGLSKPLVIRLLDFTFGENDCYEIELFPLDLDIVTVLLPEMHMIVTMLQVKEPTSSVVCSSSI